ncbi:MAG: hypothetical protein V1907_01445 [Candidatus Kerfeldbacteria bacterium]
MSKIALWAVALVALVLALITLRTANIAKQQSEVLLRERQMELAIVANCDTLEKDLKAYADKHGKYPEHLLVEMGTSISFGEPVYEYVFPSLVKIPVTEGLTSALTPHEINYLWNGDGSCEVIGHGSIGQELVHDRLPPLEGTTTGPSPPQVLQ